MKQNFFSVALRFSIAPFYAKGTEKTEALQKILKKKL